MLKDFSERENREAEERLLNHMFEELGEPVVLTEKRWLRLVSSNSSSMLA